MEDEPVVTLTENLSSDASRLLCDHNRSQIVLPTFFDPFDVRPLSRGSAGPEYALGLLNHRDCRDRIGLSARELLLVRVENPPKDEPRQNEGGTTTQLGYINNTELPGSERA